jgi:GDSL-like Lipase/Acylhydrolase family
MMPPRALVKNLAFVVFNVVVAGVIAESLLLLMLHVPRLTALSPRPMRRLVQQIYRHFNRALIQFDPQCSRYDADVTYTLKPGACTFENIEFRNEVHVNRLGLRDEDASLEGPDVILLGDSHTMGWGVEREQTFGRVLARQSGLKVLNAGISSYGTVRERMLLDRLDVSRLRILVVQYSDNDLLENRAFRDHGNHLPIMSEAQYDNASSYYSRQRAYYPGKYIYRLVMKALRLEPPEPDVTAMEPATPSEEARLFINALVHAGRARLDQTRVVVLEVNEQLQDRRAFIVALGSAKGDAANPPFIQQLTTLDLSSVLTPGDFFVLDDHMNARGHEAVGTALAVLLRSFGTPDRTR